MKKFISTTAITFLMVSTASAVVGNPGVSRFEGGPDAICRILARKIDKSLSYICTGTLVAPHKVLTAAHCYPEEGQTLTVECGYRGFTPEELSWETTRSGSKVYTRGVHFSESANAQPFYKDLARDQALLILDKDLKSTPIPVVAEVSLENAQRCELTGYGRTNDTTAGVLYRGPVGNLGVSETGALVPATLVRIRGAKDIDLTIGGNVNKISESDYIVDKNRNAANRPGDSGSSLLCKSETGEKFVAAVNSGSSMQFSGQLSPAKDVIANISEVIQFNIMYRSRPGIIQAIGAEVAPPEPSSVTPDGDQYTFPNGIDFNL